MSLLFSGGARPPELPSPETVLAAAAFVLAVVAARFPLRWLGWWERPLARLARRKRLAILVAGLSPLLLRAVLLPWFPIPEPRVHDEFSFLLAADTFAHGRLVNPPHPLWVHFESIHILARPVYASAFPIAQAAVLAAGTILFHHPWAGVWLSAGLMCAAVCWMLQGWLPPRWALLGAVLIVLRLAVSSYWMNSYWGGCVAAAGGALVLGALPRMMRRPHWRHAAQMAAGLAILAHSRPVEGAFLGLAAAIPLFTWMLGKQGPPRSVALRQIVLPLSLLLALAGAATACYFARVTGKPWMAPYVLYRAGVSMAPHFLWQRPGPEPLYNNQEMRHFYVYSEMASYREARAPLAAGLMRKAAAYWRFYVGTLLSIPLLTLPLLWRRRQSRQLLVMAAVFSLALVGQVWHNVHYAAPATGLAILIVVMGLRTLRLWRWRRHPTGLYLVRCLPMACVLMLLVQTVAPRAQDGPIEQRSWRWPPPGNVARARILRQLASTGEDHLVFVRYGTAHDPGDEWVYNAADIDRARVVWARELDPASNAKLLRYYAGRRAWLMEPDLPSAPLTPYRDAPFRPMPFVQLGAPGIAVLRSAAEVGRKVLETAGVREDTPLSCYGWNFVFTHATGVAGPAVNGECYGGNDRARPVAFTQWFSWLVRQR
ncbi:MAG: hypothetical protein LAP87_01570 [Acidobacteriia bacterium]|nr:hypothetical protein [Terriglobia bacterium]